MDSCGSGALRACLTSSTASRIEGLPVSRCLLHWARGSFVCCSSLMPLGGGEIKKLVQSTARNFLRSITSEMMLPISVQTACVEYLARGDRRLQLGGVSRYIWPINRMLKAQYQCRTSSRRTTWFVGLPSLLMAVFLEGSVDGS